MRTHVLLLAASYPFTAQNSADSRASVSYIGYLKMRWWVFLLLLCATPGEGADLHADGAIDTRFGLTRKLDVVLHNRARVVAHNNDWYDVSLVPILRYQVIRSVQVYGGAFVTWFNFPERGWTVVYRPMAGVEPYLDRGHFKLSARTGYERFVQTAHLGDFNRYRQRFRIQGKGKCTPYANIELFFNDSGFLTTRYGCGVRRDLSKHDGIELGYWYETSKFTEGGMRHMVSLTFHLNFKGLAPDF